MKFSIQTSLAVLASFALLLTCWHYLTVVLWGLVLGFPTVVMIIGLTSPQNGRQLDPSRRWYLFLLAKTWLLTVSGLILVAITLSFFPGLSNRVDRAMNGDFRAYQTGISFYGDPMETPAGEARRWKIYDSKGLVGECHGFGVWEKEGQRLVYCKVSTNRKEFVYGKRFSLHVERQEDGTLMIKDP